MGQATSYFYNDIKPIKRTYGWIKDKISDEDIYHNLMLHPALTSVKSVDLRDKCPPIYDQGNLGSCTANAIAAAYQFDEMKQGESNAFIPSRLFIYYNERNIEGTVSTDSGAQIRDGIKSINTVGVCPETMWPYDPTKFTDQPSSECYADAKQYHTVQYKKLEQDLNQFKQCLLEGLPFVFGIVVYESFESDAVTQTGNVPMPNTDTEKQIGGHAMMCVGYDTDKQVFIVRNSWNNSWGDKGYCYIPFDYLANTDLQLASDFWTIETVSQ